MNLRDRALGKVEDALVYLEEPKYWSTPEYAKHGLSLGIALIMLLVDISESLESIKELIRTNREFE